MLIYLQMLESEEDKSKFTQLYMKYKGLMFYTAKRIVSNDSDAEDVVHEAFLAIMRHLHKISEIDCLKTRSFIVIIVERKAIDHLRKHKQEVVACDDRLYVSSFHVPVLSDYGLMNALAELSPEYQQLIVWRYFHGYSVREIAKMLGKSYAAVDKMLWRGKKELEKQLKDMKVIRWEVSDEEKS